METMSVNYMLLAITGIYLAQSIYAVVNGGIRDRNLLRPFFMVIVFIFVLIATIMGVGYMDFKTAIETGNWDFLTKY